mmetsp:Transcript_147312/g.274451  ORF Transcript_147312/g.274451 Transcript_147312/m.274451 type:complete len:272 (+) Transcript_147312:1371-2186(+)
MSPLSIACMASAASSFASSGSSCGGSSGFVGCCTLSFSTSASAPPYLERIFRKTASASAAPSSGSLALLFSSRLHQSVAALAPRPRRPADLPNASVPSLAPSGLLSRLRARLRLRLRSLLLLRRLCRRSPCCRLSRLLLRARTTGADVPPSLSAAAACASAAARILARRRQAEPPSPTVRCLGTLLVTDVGALCVNSSPLRLRFSSRSCTFFSSGSGRLGFFLVSRSTPSLLKKSPSSFKPLLSWVFFGSSEASPGLVISPTAPAPITFSF